jgi:two-component system, HptB-dependent secretion and biofilm response regulator
MRRRVAIVLDVDALRRDDAVARVLAALDGLPELRAHRAELFLIVAELYNNALEHGLLGLGSSTKAEPGGFEAYYAARSAGLASLAAGSIRIDVEVEKRRVGAHLRVRVTDTGSGLGAAARAAPARKPPAPEARGGRGLALLRSLGAVVTIDAPASSVTVDYAVPVAIGVS